MQLGKRESILATLSEWAPKLLKRRAIGNKTSFSLYGGTGQCAEAATKLGYDAIVIDEARHEPNDLTSVKLHKAILSSLELRTIDV